MRLPLLALTAVLLVPQASLAQLENPEGSCCEPVKPACAEVTVGSEDEGWALRCRDELADFVEDLEAYEQCVVGRIGTMRDLATSELERVECLVEQEQSSSDGDMDCE